MKKSILFKQQEKNQTHQKFVQSLTKRNNLADRLFDRPDTRSFHYKRPKVFSNDCQKNPLTPSIVKQYHKKISQQQLPPIQKNKTNLNRLKTQSGIQQYVAIEKLNSLKKISQQDQKKSYFAFKQKNAMNKTKYFQTKLMNRTLSDSRHVVNLMQKMQGKNDSPFKQEKLQTMTSKKNIQKLKTEISPLKNQKQQPTIQSFKQIDLFIYMSEDGRVPDYQFYYMLKVLSNDYYNMDIVTYQTILKNKAAISQYFTLSGCGITKYQMSRPVEFIPLNQWDTQRKQFNEIKELQFFKKFRKWKTLKKWITILNKQKLSRICEILSEKLFILNPQYRFILLQHSAHNFQLQQMSCITIPNEPLTIENFRAQQEKKKNKLISNLKQLSKNMHNCSNEGLKMVVEDLKSKIAGDNTVQEIPDKNDKNLDEKTQIFTKLGFPSYISYGHRSMIRSQFMRFLRFAYLLDFLVIQALGKMFIANIQLLQKYMLFGNQQYYNGTYCEYALLPQGLQFGVTNNSQGKNIYLQQSSSIKALFLIQIKLNQQSYSQQKVNNQFSSENQAILKEKYLSLVGSSFQTKQTTFQDVSEQFYKFDLEGFVVANLGVPLQNVFSYDENTLITYRYDQNIAQKTLLINPKKDLIISNILDFFNDTLDSVQVISKWAKNQQFNQYISALEQWDQIIGENWQKTDSKYINPMNWIRESSVFKSFKNYIKNSINNTYLSVQKLLKQHTQILNFFVRNVITDFQKLMDPMIQQQTTVFDLIYQKMIQADQFINVYLIQKADLFIYSLDFSQMCFSFKNNHKNVIKNLCIIYGKIIKQRSFDRKKWLQVSISQLSGLIIRIQDFLTQKINLDRIINDLPKKKEDIQVLVKLLKILENSEFGGVLTKQQKQIVTELGVLSGNLFVAINDVQSQLPKYIERFRKQIKQTLQKFQKQVEEIKDRINQEKFTKNCSNLNQTADQLNFLQKKINDLQNYSKKHRQYQQVLQITQFTNFKTFRQIKQDYLIKQKIFNGIIDLEKYASDWNKMKIMMIDVKQISVVCDKYMKDLLSAERLIPDNKALPIFKKLLFVFKDAIPVISALRCPYLQSEDYRKIQKLLKTEVQLYENQQLTLGQFLEMPFQQVQEQIIDISVYSTQYSFLKKQLEGFQTEWMQTQIKLKQFRQSSDIIIIYDLEQLITKLDQSLAVVSNLLSNRYIGPLREKTQKLLNDVILGQQIIQKIVQCQKKWVYLQNIFAAPDIKKQLMIEAGFFVTADKFLKNLMKKTIVKPLISRLIKINNVLTDLTKNLQLLQQIQKKLEDYLQVKRRLFSRFYFISNDQLVQILANSNNIIIIQKHINKLFEGIGQLYIQKETPSTIDGINSPQSQNIKFINGVSTRFNIQIWLSNLQKEMIQTVKRFIRDGFKNYINVVQKTRVQWVLNHKSQVVTTANQIIWCNETQQAIKQQTVKRDSLVIWYEMLIKQLQQITELIRTDLKPIYHKIAVSLITADVHNRDIILNLINSQIESIHDFGWQQQLKYYLDQSDHCSVKQVNATMDYGYQYLGATTRLVITPLTDKCWITITSAVANHLGAAPAGPAGTGKTQSTKDLAKGLGRVCIVFNCSDQITAQMMSKLFSGLAQQGAWTCLDQFNRIDIQVLSVIAQQLFTIRVGLKRDKGEVQIEGKLLPIRRNFGVFITMNPGYAGRTQLPDNLKSLFRPVSMMIPDYTMIAQIMLFAEGFMNASDLSRKMVQLYKLASQQLSQQKHYDFGLRAVKSLLVMAGQLKKNDSKSSQQVVLIKAMKQSNIPKFIQSDINLFEALVSDLFPTIQIENVINVKMIQRINSIGQEKRLGGIQQVATKVIQLHQVMNVRFGVMIVGAAGVGKTLIYKVLKQTMKKIIENNPQIEKKYYQVQEKVINPKSVTMGQLYGQIDPMSQQWTDGVLSSLIREANNCQSKSHYWITLDGPVDALWIQNLNTVLDDNMTLCLANGQRIKLRSELRMLFEVQNLEAASPATVSRCGMVYVSQKPVFIYHINSQINNLEWEQDFKKHLSNVTLKTIEKLLVQKEKWFQPMPTIKLQVAQSYMTLIKHFLPKNKFSNSYEENIKRINIVSAYSLIWAVGASIQAKFYSQFEILLRNQIQSIHLPKTQTIFDFFIHPENQLSFLSWEAKLQDFQYQKNLQFHQIIVPTIDTLKFKYLIQLFLNQRKPILITGQSGVGKTSLTVPFLFNLKENGVNPVFLNFSAKTKPKQTQLAIQSKLNKKAKTIFGARPNESIVIFIDDINLPQLQKEGAQPTIQLLRQFLDYQGFYDRFKFFWKQVVDTNLISCGATPSGGRNPLNKRFTRHSMIVCLPEPSQTNLKKIFGSILKGFFNSCNFNQNIKKLSDGIVSGTLDFYKTIKKQLLPIPSKFHYLFNLRDISKVFQGILQSSIEIITNTEKMLQLWVHQISRIFSDRLNDQIDSKWFYSTVSKISKRYTQGLDQEKIIVGGIGINFSYILTAQTEQKMYEHIEEFKKVNQYLDSKIYQYNIQMNGKLDLVFFKQAIQHILRISRIIFQPRGNAMLIGVGGSGKQSLSKISAFISQSKIFQLQMGRGYNIQSFKGDLQKIAVTSGAEEQKLCFLFVDTQIIYEEFLQSINNMLNTGQVPNLFKKKQQIDQIMNKVRPNAIKKKKIDSPQSLWSYFIQNIRSNLHIILCMSPAGDALRIRSRKFPSLISCCTIDWFNSWTQQALLQVSKKFINSMPLEQNQKLNYNILCTQSNVLIKEMCNQYYESQKRKVQTTPKTFLDQLVLFSEVLNKKNQDIELSKKILLQGLDKLYSTNEIVSKLKIQMTKLQPKLTQQAIKTDQFLKRLAIDKQQANIVQSQVQAETAQANEQMIQIKAIKQQAQFQLGKAMPMLLEAEQALKKINKNDITQIKGYANPHPIVQMVMEAVCVLLNQKTDWASIKVVMMEMNFLDRLKNYQKNNISDNILKKLRFYTTKNEFDPTVVGQKNLASKSLCMWCKAIDNYSKVAKQVQPKKKKLNQLQKVFDDKNKILFMKQKQLQKVKNQVAKLQKQCQQTLQLKNKLQNDLDLTVRRLERAQKLSVLLKDEGLRWNSMIQMYKSTALQIPAQAYLASLYLSYMGPFIGSYRDSFKQKTLQRLKQNKVVCPSNFSLVATLYDQVTVRDWILQGLPNDQISIQNSVIAKNGKRYPLMIDPQRQANKWLKVNEHHRNLAIVNFDETHYLKTIQTAVKCGYTVLIQQIQQTLQSSIDNLLQRKVQIIQGVKMIGLGDKKITYDDKFYLYMTSRLSNPKFLAEIFNKSTVINFSITQDGLKDQLLSDVCKLQRPQIQRQRDDIIVKVAANKKFLKEAQQKTLKLLAETQGMILDDTELIITLQQSKLKSKQVQKDLQNNSIIEQQVNRARSIYLNVAIRGTILYFVIAKLCEIQPMYEFSLNYVKKLYISGLEKAEPHQIMDLRIRKLNQSITKVMYRDISKALFQAHKKIYSFLICVAIKRKSNHISDKQWKLFTRGPGIKQKNFKQIVPNPDSSIISSEMWFYLHKISQLQDMGGILSDIKNNCQTYKLFFNQNIFIKKFPGKQVNITDNFTLLLLGKVFKPQNSTFYMSQYVKRQLGKYYDEAHVTSIQQLLSSSIYDVPLLFILSTGVDPTNNILNYCQLKNINLQTISLGQGQGKKAANLIERSKNDGTWILLNNCHLSKSWLCSLQKIIENFNQNTIVNKNFRLLMSSMPVNYFPSNILQNSNKFTLQPPRGIKPNIARSFKELNEQTINSCPNRRKQWLQCLYSLTFFHALLQERRKYGPLGFNIRYEFNDSDLQMSLSTLKMFLNDIKQQINWEAIWYMIGHINYGGRVTDEWDRICLITTLKKCITPQLLSNEKYFYSDNQDYYCLNCVTLQDFQITIQRILPDQDAPDVFGLNTNANLSYIIQESKYALQCINKVQPRESYGSSQSKLLDIISSLSQLPEQIIYQTVPQHLKGQNDIVLPSLTNFLFQQVDKFNNFLRIIKKSLTMLEKAINGEVSMNEDLDQMVISFQKNVIPNLWKRYCYQTLKSLANWHIDFKERMIFLDQWMKNTPNAYWISCFFFPQGLLTSFLQTHARKNKIAIDTLSFKFKMTQIQKQKIICPKEGGYIYGMFFQGAKYDYGKDTLIDQQLGKINESSNCIHLLPTENYDIQQNQYNCPLYKTGKRSGTLSTTGQSTNFILGIHLNSKTQKPESWTLKGTALICQLTN